MEAKRDYMNVSLLVKFFMSFFVKQTDNNLRIDPLDGSAQNITNQSNIPTNKEGVDHNFQHRSVSDRIRGKINVTMSKTLGDKTYFSTPLRKYLNA
jgi:hypothetical protein